VPVCPEIEIGLGTPRDSLRLVRDDDDVRLVMPKAGRDFTDDMRDYVTSRVGALMAEDLSGYVLKKDSPTCGLYRVRVYEPSGMPGRKGRGLFADELTRRWPQLPVEEEGRLRDARLRESFVAAVFAFRRLKDLFGGEWEMADLVAFHTVYKLSLLARSQKEHSALGQLVAEGAGLEPEALQARYTELFMQAMRRAPTRKRHTNVLHHIAGYFKECLDDASRHELLSLIEDYRRGVAPLMAPLTLVRHLANRFGIAYLQGQSYLEPAPRELMSSPEV
jgi:uncharacterized protein YbgA (DUF1722 family)/uncharacterized protein YbbK (DUF523 family)